jgi:ABC-type sugar transport system ATPase subunit
MNHGIIEQVGTPQELYHSPKTRFVAGFIGSPAMNFIPCRMEEANGSLSVRLTDTISFPVPERRAGHYRSHARNGKLLLGLRSTSRRRMRIWNRARCRSMPISTSPSRWAWKRWCTSR